MIYTIGHSRHPAERFVELLQLHAIQVVGDVRSTPFSRFNPQFNRERLAATLRAAGIDYVSFSEELGARAKDPGCYDGDRVSYAKLARSAAFQSGVARVLSEMKMRRLALMCAEREPLDCHRTILVARELERVGVPVTHILADGSLESNSQAIQRLIVRLKLDSTDDLFRSHAELIEEAYDVQGGKVSYVRGSA